MFRRKSASPSEGIDVHDVEQSSKDPQAPKGRPTPRRSEHGKQRVYDRAPATRKEAAVLQRQRQGERRQKAKEGIASGDERYMLGRDKGPVRAMARDVVDSRISLGTTLMPMAIAVLLTALIRQPAIYQALNVAWIGLMFIAAIDWTVLSIRVSRKAASQFPGEKRGAGLVWYLIQRSLIPRRWRQPRPVVKLGEKVL